MSTTRTVMVGDVKYRLPFIDLIPYEDDQNERLGKAIEEEGAVLVPVVCWKEKSTKADRFVVDGAHRVAHAARLKLDTVPVKMRPYESEEEAKAECESTNLDRRHLPASSLNAALKARVERVAELRKAGESYRAIAEETGTSEATARRDAATASSSGAVETPGGKVTGKDGRKRDAVKLCKRCRRVGRPVKDCKACERARRASNKPRKKKSTEAIDDFKNPVPEKRLTAWSDPWIQNTYDFLTIMQGKLLAEQIPNGMRKRAAMYPFFEQKDVVDGIGFIQHYLDQLIEHFKLKRPAGVCPDCDGVGCNTCKNKGLLPRGWYIEAAKKKVTNAE
jgi:ParB-like chromosome segregation protein Spo0J